MQKAAFLPFPRPPGLPAGLLPGLWGLLPACRPAACLWGLLPACGACCLPVGPVLLFLLNPGPGRSGILTNNKTGIISANAQRPWPACLLPAALLFLFHNNAGTIHSRIFLHTCMAGKKACQVIHHGHCHHHKRQT